MLDHHDGVAFIPQAVEHVEQLRDILEVKAGRRLIEDVERSAGGPLSQLSRQLDALSLSSRECRRVLTEADVRETDIR